MNTRGLARAALGLRSALVRWEPTRLSTDADDMLVATTEVLWWAMALDERLARDVAAYKTERKAHEDMEDMSRGLRHARNRLGHQLAEAITASHAGMSFPMVFPLTFHEMFWVSREDIDTGAGPGHENTCAGGAYERALAGRLVRATIPAFTHWLLGRPELS